jgi:hypothetical protein
MEILRGGAISGDTAFLSKNARGLELKEGMSDEAGLGFATRFYQPKDRAMVRKICADTGFLGQPIDPVFEDRELFADYLTRYYTDHEPESTIVCLRHGEVQGYVMASRFPGRKARFEAWHNLWLALRGGWRYFSRPYQTSTRKYVKWVLTQGAKQTPFTPKGIPHFHINLRPEARNVANARVLVDAMLTYLAGCGDKAVYGQMVAFEKRRGERLFARLGFEVLDKVEVTKYREFFSGPVYLYTVVKDLTANPTMHELDLSKETENSNPA